MSNRIESNGYASRFTLHASRFTKGFRSAALIGVASLSLAACGGGESTDPARKSLLDQREKEITAREVAVKTKDTQQTAKEAELNERQAALEQTASVGFSGSDFSSDEIIQLVNTINRIQDGQDVRFTDQAYAGIVVRTKLYRKGKTMLGRIIPSNTAVDGESGYYSFKFSEFYGLDYSSGNVHTSYARDLETMVVDTLIKPSDLDISLDDNYSYKVFKGEFDTNKDNTKDVKIHYEIATDYASDNTSDYKTWGFWIATPIGTSINAYTDYNFSAYFRANAEFEGNKVRALTGTAEYRGSMLGLHTEIEANGRAKLSRLTGNVKFDVDFKDASTPGTFTAKIDSLKLNGTAAPGSIAWTQDLEGKRDFTGYIEGEPGDAISINGSKYQGTFHLKFTGPSPTDATHPSGILGLVNGRSDDRAKSFVAAFGVDKQ